MIKTIELKVYDKKDYFSEDGEYDEVKEFCEDNDITEDEFEVLQNRIDILPDFYSFTEDETVINEFLKNVSNPDEIIDTDNLICGKIYENLWKKYDIEIVDFKVEVLSIK